MDRISQIKNAILELISKQKYLYEDDYSDFCYDLSSKEASAINDWIIQSYIPIRKNEVGRKYKNKVKNIVQHPSLPNQKKIKSSIQEFAFTDSMNSIVADVDKLAGIFEETKLQVEQAMKSYANDKDIDWKDVKEKFNKAVRIQDLDGMRQLQRTFADSRFATCVAFNGVSFKACVAFSNIDKAKGLEVFSSLDADTGMLFPFDNADHVSFHMGSVAFPIDILFLMDTALGLKVAKIVHNAQPGADDIWSCNDTSHVLEVSGGSCKKYNIKLGDICVIS